MSGDRQQVREAIAGYFGGARNTTDAGINYQGGPLAASGLGSAWPYDPKGVPDQFFTSGVPAGFGWGTAMLVQLPDLQINRIAEGGPTSGWRERHYRITCELLVISYEQHVEIAEAGFDDLLDLFVGLIYADRTLGTTNAGLYPTGRLITEAGERSTGIKVTSEPFAPLGTPDKPQRGKFGGYGTVTFDALTMVAA